MGIFESVREVKFGTIFLVCALIWLGLLLIYWVTSGESVPARQVASPEEEVTFSSSPRTEGKSGPETGVQNQVIVDLSEKEEASSPVVSDPAQTSPGVRSASPPSGSYVVQVGAFRKESGALEHLSELERKGHRVQIEVAHKDATPIYRLWLGPFENKTEAAAVLTELRDQKFEGYVRKIG